MFERFIGVKVRVWIRYALLAMTLVTVWGNRFGWAQEGPGPADELPPGAPPEMVDVSENQLPPDPCDAKDIETTMERARGDFQLCWTTYRPPGRAQMRRSMRWTIEQDGRVVDVIVEPGELLPAEKPTEQKTNEAEKTEAETQQEENADEPGDVPTPEFDQCLASVIAVLQFRPLTAPGVCKVSWYDDFVAEPDVVMPTDGPLEGSNELADPDGNPGEIDEGDVGWEFATGAMFGLGFGVDLPVGDTSYGLPTTYGREFDTAPAFDLIVQLRLINRLLIGGHVSFSIGPLNVDGWERGMNIDYNDSFRLAIGPTVEGAMALSHYVEFYLRLQVDFVMLGTSEGSGGGCQDEEGYDTDCPSIPNVTYWGLAAAATVGARFYFSADTDNENRGFFLFADLGYSQGLWLYLHVDKGTYPEFSPTSNTSSMFLGFGQARAGVGYEF